MNEDILKGKWTEMRGDLKTWWGQLTEDDLDVIAGQKDKLVGKIQERYGIARDKAQTEVDKHLREYEEAMKRERERAHHDIQTKE
jgi:uncharacterized protein YjbJ (UPF0337 family)